MSTETAGKPGTLSGWHGVQIRGVKGREMFSGEHAIFKFANAFGEVDDWLPYAEELVEKWSIQRSDDVKFSGVFEITLAALLLEDNLLPSPARVAFARLMCETIAEAKVCKLRIKCLHIGLLPVPKTRI